MKFPLFFLLMLIISTAGAQPGNWFGDITTTGNSAFIDITMQDRQGTKATEPMQATVTKTDAKFLFTTAPGIWSPKWVGSNDNYSRTVNARLTGADAAFYYTDGGWDHDLEVPVVNGRYYTFVIGQESAENNDMAILETNYQPVTIEDVAQDAFLVDSNQAVTIEVAFSSILSMNEYAYLHYTTDNWQNSDLIALSHQSGSTYEAQLPGFSNQTEVQYSIHTTNTEMPTIADLPYFTLRMDDNYGAWYGYTVGESVSCGTQVGVVTSEPAFPLPEGTVTIYFNAEMGNGGLVNYDGDVYIHTGLITSESTSTADWKYVLTDWGENTPETKMERLDDNLYQLEINSIHDYYGVDDGEQILKVAMVFRSDEPYNGESYYEGKNADGSDIFVNVYEQELNVKIISPSKRNILAPANQVIPVCVEAMENVNISVSVNGNPVYDEEAGSITYPLLPTDLNPGLNQIKASADDGNRNIVYDSVDIYKRQPVVEEALPEGVENGINYINDSTITLVLHDPAAQKEFAFAIGEYSNWQPNDDTYMKRTPAGTHFWITLTGLNPGKEYAYQYLIDGTMKIADPYAQKILDPWNDPWIPESTYPNLKTYPYDSTLGVVSVFQTNQTTYDWEIENFTPAAVNETQQNLVVYELLIRDFIDSSRINDVKDSLNYLANLGVNAIELMPVMEFDGNESWGYAPNFFFATDKYYGKKADYKAFIDACHQHNIAVILDIVPNHAFGQNTMLKMYFDEEAGEHGQPTPQNPWFNAVAPHPFSVGYDFNHESPYTRQFFKNVFEFWLTEFKVDGFRVDLSKGLTQTYSGSDIGAWSSYDQSRINILTDYYNHVKSVDSDAYFILEHFANNDEEKVLANTGMMLWGNMDSEFNQVVLGYESESDFSSTYHGNRDWNYPNLVAFMESHDEERRMYEAYNYGNGSGDYQITDSLTALKRMEMATVLLYSVPGPKMMWQFGELGYDYSIHYGGDRTAPKPPRWDYWNNPYRQHLYRVTSGIIELQKHEAFRNGSFTSDLAGTGKRLWISHSSMDVVIVANMDVTGFAVTPEFQQNGTWYDYYSGTSFEVSDATGHTVYLAPGEYKVFTSEPMDKPFYYVDFVVKDADDGALLHSASVSLSKSGTHKTGAQGHAWFTTNGGELSYEVTRSGYFSENGSIQVPATDSVVVELTVDPDGLPEHKGSEKFVYPNPAQSQVFVHGFKNHQYILYNLYGKVVKQGEISNNKTNINLEKCDQGVYLLKIRDRKAAGNFKIVVQ